MPERMGFFTDTSVCIGCKACEVACKEWNQVPEDGLVHTGWSMDNSRRLNADTWRHVAFIEQRRPLDISEGAPDDLVQFAAAQHVAEEVDGFRWLMASDVCKHCTEAACLEVCPTGALFRTEFDTVVVQEDICNGCGYCVTACPFGVLSKREEDGRVWKCTLCYDRLRDDQEPACAQACPTDSIQFGPLEVLRVTARERLDAVVAAGEPGAQLYLDSDDDNEVGGAGAFFLLLDDPEVYGLPPEPKTTTRDLPGLWAATAAAAGAVLGAVAAAVLGGRR